MEILKDNADILLGALLGALLGYLIGGSFLIPNIAAGAIIALASRFHGLNGVAIGIAVVLVIFIVFGWLQIDVIMERIVSLASLKIPTIQFSANQTVINQSVIP